MQYIFFTIYSSKGLHCSAHRMTKIVQQGDRADTIHRLQIALTERFTGFVTNCALPHHPSREGTATVGLERPL